MTNLIDQFLFILTLPIKGHSHTIPKVTTIILITVLPFYIEPSNLFHRLINTLSHQVLDEGNRFFSITREVFQLLYDE
jgi:hypothetical protein